MRSFFIDSFKRETDGREKRRKKNKDQEKTSDRLITDHRSSPRNS